MGTKWTPELERKLKDTIGKVGPRAFARAHGFTFGQVAGKAYRLGLTKRPWERADRWKAEQEAALLAGTPIRVVARQRGITPKSAYDKAKRMGLLNAAHERRAELLRHSTDDLIQRIDRAAIRRRAQDFLEWRRARAGL